MNPLNFPYCPIPSDNPEDRRRIPSRLPETDAEATFSYATVGMPEPGKQFNSTRVAVDDLAAFDNELNNILKPYNVGFGQYRTLTVTTNS